MAKGKLEADNTARKQRGSNPGKKAVAPLEPVQQPGKWGVNGNGQKTLTLEVERPPFDPVKAVKGMRPADAAQLGQSLKRYEAMPDPVRVKITRLGERKWHSEFQGDDNARSVNEIRLRAAFGTLSQPFIDVVMGDLMTIWDSNGGVSEKQYNAALAVLESVQPQNPLEAMLVVQMIAANEAALRSTAMIGKSCMPEHMASMGNLANKFMRTYSGNMETLAKLRRNGEQIVKHVYVQAGGQAVIAGTVNSGGGGGKLESGQQPYGAGVFPVSAALPGPNAAWNGVPVPGHAQREMSPTRRQESGSAEGKPERLEARPSLGGVSGDEAASAVDAG